MTITLRIDNFDQLADGGPIAYTAGARGFDIGRAQHLDWCLPDPTNFISSHHCQVRFENGGYWLYDISTNGTFLNGAQTRVKSPYKLSHGDRLQIGQYLVAVGLAGAEAPPQNPEEQPLFSPPPDNSDPWGAFGEAPKPVDRRLFTDQQRRNRPGYVQPDVINDYIELPKAHSPYEQVGYSAPVAAPYPAAAPYPVPGGGAAYGQPPGFPTPAVPGGMPGAGGADLTRFLGMLAQTAGISPQALVGRSPDELAMELGSILRTVTEELAGLLKARAAAKQMTKSGNRTMIGKERNNPLKFIPNPTEALEVMFQRSRPGYLSAAESFKEGLDNVKRHEMATYTAMQKALLRLMEDFHPDHIEDKAGGGAFGNKKARAWEIYQERWNAKTEHYENGMLDVFLAYFADAYDTASKG